MLRKTVNLSDRVTKIEEDLLPTNREDAARLKEEATVILAQAEEGDEEASIPPKMEREWAQLENERLMLEGERDTLERVVEEYGGAEFTLQELAYGDWNLIQDTVMEHSVEADYVREEVKGTPKEGLYKNEVLRYSVVSWPPEAPTEKDPDGREWAGVGQYPRALGDFLFDTANALNTNGELEMGNSSLREALR